MRIRFWGVRGSIASPGPDTASVGGNTSCVEVRVAGQVLIFDGGTGLRQLGEKLLREMPLTAHLFFSHVHWDHIQGFPFFTPAFVKGNTVHVYGGKNVSRTIEETLAGQMDYPNFPVTLKDMGAKMIFFTCESSSEITDERPTSEPVPLVVGSAMKWGRGRLMARRWGWSQAYSSTSPSCTASSATTFATSSAAPPPKPTTASALC